MLPLSDERRENERNEASRGLLFMRVRQPVRPMHFPYPAHSAFVVRRFVLSGFDVRNLEGAGYISNKISTVPFQTRIP